MMSRKQTNPRVKLACVGMGMAPALLICTESRAQTYTSAVYAMSNATTGNMIAAFGRSPDGRLSPIASYATGGMGGVFDDGNGSDPLLAQHALIAIDNRHLLAVNAGSNSITALRINSDFSLTPTSTVSTGGVGPNSVVHRNGRVYVANTDADGVFTGPADQIGNVGAFQFDATSGQLTPIASSTRQLPNRPSDLTFSGDGTRLIVSSVNAHSAALPNGGGSQLAVYGIAGDGTLGAAPLGTADSTLPGNSAGRNLPSAIGILGVQRGGRDFIVSTEAREFPPDGGMPALPNFQTGSLSTWELMGNGTLAPVSLDVRSGPTINSGPTSACWIVPSPSGDVLWVASESAATISSYDLNDDGTINLINGAAAAGAPFIAGAPDPLAGADGFVDIDISDDGRHLYQLRGHQGSINVYEIGSDGRSLTLLQQTSGLLPQSNVEGMVFVVPEPSTILLALPAAFVYLSRKRRAR